jgi:hypothetical protein
MLDQLFRRTRVRDRIRANILGAWIELYVAYLDAWGHLPGVIQQYVQSVEHLGIWLKSEHIAIDAVTGEVLMATSKLAAVAAVKGPPLAIGPDAVLAPRLAPVRDRGSP